MAELLVHGSLIRDKYGAALMADERDEEREAPPYEFSAGESSGETDDSGSDDDGSGESGDGKQHPPPDPDAEPTGDPPGERTAPPYEFSAGESKGDDDAPYEGGVRRDAPEYEFSAGESSGDQEADEPESEAPATAATQVPDAHYRGMHKAEKREQRERAEAERKARAEEEHQRERRNRRLKMLGAALGVAAIVVIVAIVVSSGGEATKRGGEQTGPVVGSNVVNQRFAGIPQDGLTLGNADAPVTLVEFADLQCPFCKEANDNSLPALVDRYVRPGRLRIEFRNFPILGPDSEKAARALAGAADQGKAWQFLDLWYLNQGEENSGYVTDEFIGRIARGIPGLNAQQVIDASNDEANDETIVAARRDADQFGIDSTPSYLIGRTGGQPQILQIQNPSDPNLFAQSIDRLLGQQE
jgi:protein-disulfide isomerase